MNLVFRAALLTLCWTGLAIAGPQATLTLLDGTALTGELTALTDEGVSLQTEQGPQMVPADRLMQLQMAGPSSNAPAEGQVALGLVDRSVLRGGQLESDGTNATLTATTLEKVSVPVREIANVRLAALDDKVSGSWQDLQTRNARDDLLVIRKGDVLDYVAGSVGKVTPEGVTILVKDRELTAPPDRVFGIVYAARSAPPPARRVAVRTADGDELQAESIALEKDRLQLTTASLGAVSLPVDRVRTLDYGGGRIRYLADLPFDESASKSPSAEFPVVWFVSRDAPAGTGGKAPLVIGTQEYRHGLWLHSGAVVRYRLNRDFTQLRAVAGFDLTHVTRMPRFQPRVRLVISGDGKELFSREFLWSDAPQPLEVDLSDVRELVIRIDPLGASSGILEHFALGDAQVIQ